VAPVAPLVAGHWPRRLGGLPGPFSVSMGSGDSPNGTFLQLELYVDGTWVDITSYAMTRDGSLNVAISRGISDEGSRTEPSRCTFQLNNRDGRFSPRNPLGPYFGKLGRNQPLRVSVPSGNDKAYRFWGEIAAWPSEWDVTGTDVWVNIEASGIIRRLGQGQSPIGSALKATVTAGITSDFLPVPLYPVVAYWPCEDAVNSTSIASAAPSGTAMTIQGTPTLSSFTQFVCSDALPVLADASFAGVVPTYTAPLTHAIRFLLAIPSGGITNNQVLCTWTMTGSASTWQVYYVTAGGGSIRLKVTNPGGSTLLDMTSPGDSLNGGLFLIVITADQEGADIAAVTNAQRIGATFATGTFGLVSATTMGIVTAVTVAPNRDLTNVTIGHVIVQATNSDDGTAAAFDLDDTIVANLGEKADDRIYRLATTYGIPAHQIGAVSQSVAMGYQLDHTLLDLIQECVDSDGGMLYEILDAVGLGYRTRQSLENQTAALTLSYAAFNLSDIPRPVDDDRYTRNDVTVSRVGGSSARAIQGTGPLSVLNAPAGVGRYDTVASLSLGADSDLFHIAGWRLHLGTVDEARYPRISINLAHSTFTSNPALRNQVLAVRQGDRISVTNLPTWMPADGISQIVLGFAETIDRFQHRITFTCAPESPYRIMLLEDSTLGRIDTGASQLDQPATAAATTLTVATTSGPLWTTTDTPFDILAGGERMTVTGISGATSPQTFTVTRSVNGIVKAQAAGTDVRLYQPAILAL
jgi:hypothetical protein